MKGALGRWQTDLRQHPWEVGGAHLIDASGVDQVQQGRLVREVLNQLILRLKLLRGDGVCVRGPLFVNEDLQQIHSFLFLVSNQCFRHLMPILINF